MMPDWKNEEEINETWWNKTFSHTAGSMIFLYYVMVVVAGFIILIVIVYVCRECSCEYIKAGRTGSESRHSSTGDLRIVHDDSPPETSSSMHLHHLSHHNFRVLEEYSQRMAQVLQGPPPSYDEAIKDLPPAHHPHGLIDESGNYVIRNDGEDVPLLPRDR